MRKKGRVYKAINYCARQGNAVAIYIKTLPRNSKEYKNYIRVLTKEYNERDRTRVLD